MADTTPSELLTQAADLVRDTAGKATPGPWQACEPWTSGVDYPATVQTVTTAGFPNTSVAGWAVHTEDGGFDGGLAPVNAKWIALLNPAVAPALEAILREQAELHRVMAERGDPLYAGESVLALAKALLGAPEEPKSGEET